MKNDSYITWLTFNEEDILKAREALKILNGESTVDVIGLGKPFEEISDALFPGTSTLHTRLRYVIFLAAIFYAIKIKNPPIADPAKEVQRLENSLREILEGNDMFGGVIGRIAKEDLKYPPSQTYWGALNALRMLSNQDVRRDSMYESFSSKGARTRNDDGEYEEDSELRYLTDAELKPISKALFKDIDKRALKSDISFSLTRREADYLKKKYKDLFPDSLTSVFLENFKKVDVEDKVGLFQVRKTHNDKLDFLLKHSDQYSVTACGINLTYNYALCLFVSDKRCSNKGNQQEWLKYAENNQKLFSLWLTKHHAKCVEWDISELINALEKYWGRGRAEKAVDRPLRELVATFQGHLKSNASPKRILEKMKPIIIAHEHHRRGGKSHFAFNSKVTIASNVKSEGVSDTSRLFTYRWGVGKQNALDIMEEL